MGLLSRNSFWESMFFQRYSKKVMAYIIEKKNTIRYIYNYTKTVGFVKNKFTLTFIKIQYGVLGPGSRDCEAKEGEEGQDQPAPSPLGPIHDGETVSHLADFHWITFCRFSGWGVCSVFLFLFILLLSVNHTLKSNMNQYLVITVVTYYIEFV